MIFSTHPLHPEVTAALTRLGDYRVASAPTPEAIATEGRDASVIVVRAPIPASLVAAAPSLRALVRHGAGLDMIPLEAARRAGVLVANVPGANATTVAEHVIWTALALLRRHPEVDRDLRQSGWAAGRAHADLGRDLGRLRLGIVGMGNVGSALARIALAGFGMSVACHSRTPGKALPGVAELPLADLLVRSDVLALCCPLTDETRGLIDATALARLPSGAIVINVARGPVVVEAALVESLADHLGGAALDVFDSQPLPPDHPLLTLPNVILTPHMAGITENSMLRMGQGVVAELRRLAAGELPANLIDARTVPAHLARFGTIALT